MKRRRPVPRWWRNANHSLSTSARRYGTGIRGSMTYRTRGRCSCGASWPGPGCDNLTRADVLDYWNDHVEEAWRLATVEIRK